MEDTMTYRRFEIQGRGTSIGEWSPEYCGTDHTTFFTREQAEAAIAGLRALGDDFSDADYRVIEQEDTMASISEADIRELGMFCNRDEQGRHFTERYSAEWLNRMEAAGLIEISRPIHEATGMPYSQDYWSACASARGVELVEAQEAAAQATGKGVAR